MKLKNSDPSVTPNHHFYDYSIKNLFSSSAKVTIRAAAGCLAAYYCLGYLYANGTMAKVDRAVILILKRQGMGYIAIGVAMPTVQKYTAWSIRIMAGCSTSFTLYLIEKMAVKIFSFVWKENRRNDDSPDEQPELSTGS